MVNRIYYGIAALLIMIASILSISVPVHAVTITDLTIKDILNTDLSMRETINVHILNNTEGEFKLLLPENAYDITLNGTEYNDSSISDMIACEDCSPEIEYSFPNIIMNDTEKYTYYRKIDMPINTSSLQYVILIPENYTLYNSTDLQSSLIPNPTKILDNNTFEWYFVAPQFPKEFGIRYRHAPMIPAPKMNLLPIMMIIVLLLILGISVGILFIHGKRRSKRHP